MTSYSARFANEVGQTLPSANPARWPNLTRLLALLAAWTTIGLFYLSQDVARRYFFGDPKPWREATYWIVRSCVLAAFTPAILWLGRRWPIERPLRLTRSLQHLLASVCFSVAAVAAETTILLRVGDLEALSLSGSYRRSLMILLVFVFHANVIIYWAIIGIQSGLRYYRKFQEREQQALRLELHASELKAQLVDSQLSALKMQPSAPFSLQYPQRHHGFGAPTALQRGGRDSRPVQRSAARRPERHGFTRSPAQPRAGICSALSVYRAGPLLRSPPGRNRRRCGHTGCRRAPPGPSTDRRERSPAWYCDECCARPDRHPCFALGAPIEHHHHGQWSGHARLGRRRRTRASDYPTHARVYNNCMAALRV